MDIKNVASLSMKGGRNDNFYLCLLEHFPENGRWFLKSLLPVKEEEVSSTDEAVTNWLQNYDIKKLVVDFPLSNPASESGDPVKSVKIVQDQIADILACDLKLQKENPKRYEQERNKADEIVFNKDIFSKETTAHLLSRSFKRRLKKGFLTYWNRTLDFWIWQYYYDQILQLFNTSFDSFGNTSLMIMYRFNFLKKSFPSDLELYESDEHIILVELLRSKIILKKDLDLLSDVEIGFEARLDFIKKIEHNLNIFIYDHDLEILAKTPRAFDSFLLALAGQNILQKKNRSLPDWTLPEETHFIVPDFK